MKKLFIYSLILLGLVAPVLSGCSDDVDYPDINPDIIENEGHSVTSFSLQSTHFNMPENVDSVRVALISTSGSSECFGAGVERSAESLRFRMVIPDSSPLPDGRYILTMSRPDGSPIPGRLSAEFRARMLSAVSIIIPKYMLDGSGTEDDPYLIGSDDDFSMFLINLADDKDSYGAGLVFRQTADVNAPDQSTLIPGRGYWGAPFAGIYQGDNHTIRSLFYRGNGRAESDSGIGLFTNLLGTASISSLSLSGVAMSGLYEESGAIAAHTSGEITLSGVSVAGYVNDGSSIGGVVGNVADGSLTLRNVALRMNVTGNESIGGLVGRVDKSASLKVDGVTTPDYHFSISGSQNVGGIVGQAIGKTEISNARLEHKVSGEDSDIKIIEGKKGSVGGLIGAVASDAGAQTLSKCYVLCPVGGSQAQCVGGFVGYSAQSGRLTIDDCRMQSVVEGSQYTGGVIGKAEFSAGSDGLCVIGSNFGTRISADDADAKVKGGDYTGGIAGWWKGRLELCDKVRINLPVTGNKYVGGAFGCVSGCTVHTDNIVFGPGNDNNATTTMRVTGTTSTGGFVGLLTNSTLTGTNKFEPSQNFRPASWPEPVSEFSGVVMGKDNTGGMVGHAEGSVVQYLCSSASVNGSKNVGGIVGYFYEPSNSTLLKNCFFKGSINLPDVTYVGGIVGLYKSHARGNISSCVNYSNIRGGHCTGGICGYITKSVPSEYCSAEDRYFEMSWCVNKGDIEGVEHIGGIVGFLHAYFIGDYPTVDMLMSACMNSGNITGKSDGDSTSGIGGIAGNVGANSGVMYCSNHGNVTGHGNFHGVGGVVGVAGIDSAGAGLLDKYLNTDIKQCMNSGTVTSDDSSSFVGGVIGYLEEGTRSDVNDCHNLGDVPCRQNHDSGGIIGCVDHLTNIYRVVNQGMVSHGNAIIGTHKSGSLFNHGELYFLEGTGANWPSATKVSKSDFKKESSFRGLDFKDVWIIGASGPELRNCLWKNK